MWTRDPSGQWSGPTDAATAGSLVGQPVIVAGNGRAYAAFISSDTAGACDEPAGRNADVQEVFYDGSTWSAPQNLTSCVPNTDILQFDTPKLALDEQGRAYLVSEANGNLWYTDNTSGSWSEPALITQGANIPGSVGTSLRTFYGIAASNGTVYVTFTRHADTPTDDVLLMSHPGGGPWSAPARVSPQDPQDCPKFGLSIVANEGRVGVSYVRGSLGYCHASGGADGSVPFVYTGSPEQMSAVGSLEGKSPNCFATSLANEGNLFRFVAACDQPSTLSRGQLYYKAEFLDTVGPVAHLVATARASAPAIGLHWSARDPQPGSGVAFYSVEVRDATGSWHTLLASTHATQLIYRQAHAGHRYIFRLRAQDRTANWGAWVMASTRAG
ncbi:MAG TPA: fibronectin type III domain-containing protein [Chloroflexota bacterium]